MMYLIKIIFYCVIVYILNDYGFTLEHRPMPLLVIMSGVLLIDIVSYFGAVFATRKEIFGDEE